MAKRSISSLRDELKEWQQHAYNRQVEVDKAEAIRNELLLKIKELHKSNESLSSAARRTRESHIEARSHLHTMARQQAESNRALSLALLRIADILLVE